MRPTRLAAIIASVAILQNAVAGWGLRYEVDAGSGWTSHVTLTSDATPVSVDFRIVVFHDGQMFVQPAKIPGLTWYPPLLPGFAVAPLRLCSSHRITNFGAAGMSDSLISFRANVSNRHAKALASSQVEADMILGTPHSKYSFASNLTYGLSLPASTVLQTPFYSGRIQIGEGRGASRTITLAANSFGYEGADDGNGGTNGASFYIDPSRSNWGPAPTPATVMPATITVLRSCRCDFDGNRVVDDSDFAVFALAFQGGYCDESLALSACPADLNTDSVVDDSDFAMFAAAYDAIFCP